MQVRSALLMFAFAITVALFADSRAAFSQSVLESAEQAKLDFFESKIRPALIDHCIECHSAETEASGGLLLDSKSGWSEGGDSGPAIIPADPEQSRLFVAMTYDNPDFLRVICNFLRVSTDAQAYTFLQSAHQCSS